MSYLSFYKRYQVPKLPYLLSFFTGHFFEKHLIYVLIGKLYYRSYGPDFNNSRFYTTLLLTVLSFINHEIL